MASVMANLMRAQIVLLNPLIKRLDIRSARKMQDGLGKLGVKIMTEGVHHRDEAFDNFEATWAEPDDMDATHAILYLHGGSYTAGSLAYARCFGSVLAGKTGYPVLCVGYRLAPEDPYPAALEDALAAYRRMLERFSADKIILAGESAGGGLCFALCLHLKELGLRQPARVVAISPWTDLDMAGDYRETAMHDPVLSAENLRYSAGLYAGDNDRRLPTISPLFGELGSLPPTLIMAGSDEILLRDSEGIAKKLTEAGVPCTLQVAKDMWHVYIVYGIPEAKEALDKIRAFVRAAEEVMPHGECPAAGELCVDQT